MLHELYYNAHTKQLLPARKFSYIYNSEPQPISSMLYELFNIRWSKLLGRNM